MLKEVLSRSAELVRAGWTQNLAARDVQGDEVSPLSQDACRFCVIGAIERAVHDIQGSGDVPTECAVRDHVRKFLTDKTNQSLVVFNDAQDRMLTEVTDLLDRSIAALA